MLDHRTRAAAALLAVRAVRTSPVPAKKYVARTKDLGLMIRRNSLLHALVFLRTKKHAEGGDLIARQVCDHLQQQGLLRREDPLTELSSMERPDYLRAQNEAMAFAQWLKRLAVAEHGDAQPGDDA